MKCTHTVWYIFFRLCLQAILYDFWCWLLFVGDVKVHWTSFLKFKAGEPDEASDAKRACTENEDNKWFFLIQFQPLLKPI
jgi:hypothetical protein